MQTAEYILLKEMGVYHIEQKLLVINAMKEYAKQACEAQREECLAAYINAPDYYVACCDAIRSAPLIELE